MKVIKVEVDKLEKEQYNNNRNEPLGVITIKHKVKGGFGKFTKKGLTTKGKSGRMKTFLFNPKLESWNLYINKEIDFIEMKERQKAGM